MSKTEALGSSTGSSLGLGDTVESPTRTIADLVNETGFLKNRTKILVTDLNEVHQTSEELHIESLRMHHRTLSHKLAKENLSGLLDALSDLGLSWREIARVSGVSIPAVRKWRNGEQATGENRRRVAMLAALCQLAQDEYLIDDVAGWLEVPLHLDVPLTVLDLVVEDRFDLALQLASERDADPERVLDQFDPEWRERYSSAVEVFTAPDGLLGVRFTEGAN